MREHMNSDLNSNSNQVRSNLMLTAEQKEVLSHHKTLTAFIYLLDSALTLEQLSKRTGYKPIEISVYLERMKDVHLVKESKILQISGRSLQFVYEVVNPQIDLSEVVPILSSLGTLDVLYNKMKTDLHELHSKNQLSSNSFVKYLVVKAQPKLFDQLKSKLMEVEELLQQAENSNGEECVQLLWISYKLDDINEI